MIKAIPPQVKKQLLEQIASNIKVCNKCGLCNTRNNAVPGEGSHNSKLFFLGEAPGRNEDMTGKPFCGAAGKILDMGLNEAKLKRKNVFITSVVKCRPPKNRNPNKDELVACKPFIDAQIKIIQPKIIVLLGNFGLKHFFPDKNISDVRGTILEKDGLTFYPILHPAAIIYRRSMMDSYLNDFRNLKILLDTKFK